MPIVKSELEGGPPKGPHLAFQHKEGLFTAVPPGATVVVVVPDKEEKGRDHIVPMILLKVSKDTLLFRCACGKEGCSRLLHYKLKAAGKHPGK